MIRSMVSLVLGETFRVQVRNMGDLQQLAIFAILQLETNFFVHM